MRNGELLILGPEDLCDSKNVKNIDSLMEFKRSALDELLKANIAIFLTDADHKHLNSKIIKNRYF